MKKNNMVLTYIPRSGYTRLGYGVDPKEKKGYVLAAQSDAYIAPGTVPPKKVMEDDKDAQAELMIELDNPVQAQVWADAFQRLAQMMGMPPQQVDSNDTELEDSDEDEETDLSFWGGAFDMAGSDEKLRMILDVANMDSCPESFTRADLHLMLQHLVSEVFDSDAEEESDLCDEDCENCKCCKSDAQGAKD